MGVLLTSSESETLDSIEYCFMIFTHIYEFIMSMVIIIMAMVIVMVMVIIIMGASKPG